MLCKNYIVKYKTPNIFSIVDSVTCSDFLKLSSVLAGYNQDFREVIMVRLNPSLRIVEFENDYL